MSETADDVRPAEFRFAIRTEMDRRRAEALALELRRRMTELGVEGARITIEPDRGRDAGAARPTHGESGERG